MEGLKITVLGSGTSQGVPVIACDCDVCFSDNAKDKRLRSSILVSFQDKNVVIDTGPDFRQQMLTNNVKTLEAVVFTHEHKDHVAGMDDVRAYNFKQKADMPVYCDSRVLKALMREYQYIFFENPYPGIPKVQVQNIGLDPFVVAGMKFIPVEVMHYILPVLGFRIGDFAYITDAKTVSLVERKKLEGVKVLIVNALHKKEHISHFNLDEALQFIEDINPEKAYLTHISHFMGKHEETEKTLPSNVRIAYDGQVIEL
jgi:phosphoribosyl 1,2-cyclic phosphate phosphodiesterase